MVKFADTLAHAASLVRAPRAKPDMYRDYNILRQYYILDASAKHFNVGADDPAPLYGKTLLDVGCGESTIAQFLALSGADITAIDVDLGSISFAETAAKAFGAPIHFINAPVESLIQHTQKYDVILALDVLETVPDAPKLLWVMKQLLAPGGLIIISHITRSPKAWFMHVFLSSIIYRRTHRHSGDVRRFHTPRQLGRLCQKVGLTLTNVQGLRLSASKHRWKLSSHVDTRYLATAS